MRAPLSRQEVHDLSEDTFSGSAGQNRALAERFVSCADDPHPGDEPTPGELLAWAGEHFEQAEDLAEAEDAYRRAHLTGDWGPTLDPRCLLIDLLLGQGRTAEAAVVDDQLRKARPDSALVYQLAGESWESAGEPQRALGWLNRALAYAQRTGAFSDSDIEGLCGARWRIRNSQGMDPDTYDELVIALREQRK